jgi:nitrite reductase/ring-hydroxylating ferredoxin subunit
MGELFRRFWLPAVLSEEIAAPDSPPVRLRILCEDLLAFRDSSGRVGIVEAYCSHRGAPLFFGRNEECGLRCPYHGWKFNVDGVCVDVPNAPPNIREKAQLREKLAITAYPAREAGGVVWVYMGPKTLTPELPQLEWTTVPKGYCHTSRWLQRSSWLQGAEGEIDTSHVSFLHKDLDPSASMIAATGVQYATDGAPVISIKETDYGFKSGARRQLGNEYFWRLSQWLAPMYSLIPRAPGDTFRDGGGRAWVPVDDNHTTTFAYAFRVDRPLNEEEHKLFADGAHFPPRMTKGSIQLADGHRFDTFLPVADATNDYLVDRERQRTVNFTGIWGVNEQDRSLQESLRGSGPKARGIVDRSREHLMGSDLAIVTARRRLLRMVRDLQKGVEPQEAARGSIYSVRAISKICGIAGLDEFLQTYRDDARTLADA